jgi:putative transposase
MSESMTDFWDNGSWPKVPLDCFWDHEPLLKSTLKDFWDKKSAPFVAVFESMLPGQSISKDDLLKFGDPGGRHWNIRGAIGSLKKRKDNPIEIRDIGNGYLRVDPATSPKTHIRAFRFPLSPTPEQLTILANNWSARDEAYNESLAYIRDHARPGERLWIPSARAVQDHVNARLRAMPWFGKVNVHIHAITSGIDDCILAAKRWQKDYQPKTEGEPNRWKKGMPSFRSVKTGSTYTVSSPRAKWEHAIIRLPLFTKDGIRSRRKLSGWIPNGAIPREATVFYDKGLVWCSLVVQIEEPPAVHKRKTVAGVDWGVKTFATVSDGTAFHLPCKIVELDKEIDRIKSQLSRMEGPKGIDSGRNRDRTPKKQRAYREPSRRYKLLDAKRQRLQRKRMDMLLHVQHHATYVLTRKFGEIVCETIDLPRGKGRQKNVKQKAGLNRAISRNAPGRFFTQLGYKSERTGTVITKVPKNFPSTQTCSECGYRRQGHERLGLSARVYTCPSCDSSKNRDKNASETLEAQSVMGYKRASQ